MNSNLRIKSNLIVDDEKYQPVYKYIPGDLIGEIYPNMLDKRCIEQDLTFKQRIEYEQYLICNICKKPCAGTCREVNT